MTHYDLDKRGTLSKYQYLHRCIRDDIRKGTLSAGSRLPAKRLLAHDLEVSVSTVEHAYSLLVSEGYLTVKPGSGFVVCPGKAEEVNSSKNNREQNNESSKDKDQGQECASFQHLIDFKANRCSLELFPLDTWSRLMRQVLSERNPAMLEPIPFNGLYSLRKAIATNLYESKGICVSPDRIVVGAGTEYLYGKLLQLLADRQTIAIEDPGYKIFSEVSRSYGIRWDYIPLDGYGLSVKHLKKSSAQVVHVSPANHFPSGVVMSSRRRQELLDWLHEDARRLIIEDDYDSEIRYGGRAPASLITQDESERVIYLNTFSKTLVPSLRIAYMILPENLMNQYRDQLSFYSCTVSSFEQSTLAKFISDGYFERHINRLRRHYKKQREQVLKALTHSKIAPFITVYAGEVGTHFLLDIDTAKSDEEIKEMAAKRGVELAMLSDYCAGDIQNSKHCIVVNFASVSANYISGAIMLLEEIFCEEIDSLPGGFSGSGRSGSSGGSGFSGKK